jgi:hypothetical protein
VPDVTLGEPRSLAYLANEPVRHAHPDAGMLTMAAPSGTGGTPAAVTDGDGGVDVRRASNRRSVRQSRSFGIAADTAPNSYSAGFCPPELADAPQSPPRSSMRSPGPPDLAPGRVMIVRLMSMSGGPALDTPGGRSRVWRPV